MHFQQKILKGKFIILLDYQTQFPVPEHKPSIYGKYLEYITLAKVLAREYLL